MSYTSAQVGAANIPDAHTGRAAPTAMEGIDQDGTEIPAVSRVGLFSGFGWRARQTKGPAPRIALGDTMTERAGEHANAGKPDPRRTETELTGHPSGESRRFAPMVEDYTNERRDVAIAPEAPPARPRQGWTGDDNTRAARYTVAFLMRPFDKAIAEHPGPIIKDEARSPQAATPPNRDPLKGGLPSPMGSAGTAAEGVGPTPNTFRLMPRRWDALVVNTGGPAATGSNDPAQDAAAAARGRSFRL